MNPITPYVHFQGNCSEALDFYTKILGGKVVFSMPMGGMPGADKMPADYKDKIMHAHFQAGGLNLFASDCPPNYKLERGNNTSLNLKFNDISLLDKVFEQFTEGADVKMPVQDTFWGERFGMLTDKFGINWMFSSDLPK